VKQWEKPEVINTAKALTYAIAISGLKTEGKCPEATVHRQIQILEQCRRGRPWQAEAVDPPRTRFKTLKIAYATIRGFEAMRALRKGQATAFNLTRDIRGEARIVERAFGVGVSALAESIAALSEALEQQTA